MHQREEYSTRKRPILFSSLERFCTKMTIEDSPISSKSVFIKIIFDPYST